MYGAAHLITSIMYPRLELWHGRYRVKIWDGVNMLFQVLEAGALKIMLTIDRHTMIHITQFGRR